MNLFKPENERNWHNWTEITREAWIALVGNDEHSWIDYIETPVVERGEPMMIEQSFYRNNGHNLVTVTYQSSNEHTRYFIQ